MWRAATAFFALTSTLIGCQGVTVAHLNASSNSADSIISHFESANPGYRLSWETGVSTLKVSQPSVVFVQSGEGTAKGNRWTSPFGIGDLLRAPEDEKIILDPPADLLIFGLPAPLDPELPAIIRPDWDGKITDTPGGCAAEEDAYRRILLTWQASKGPYLSHQINAHRVRIRDSFTHYHPVNGGFDEFYLVQEAPPGARLIVGENLQDILEPSRLTKEEAKQLLKEIPLKKGDLVYLPRGVAHRGVGGAVVQVITVPGFVPGAEIPLDDAIRKINKQFELDPNEALPNHQGNSFINFQVSDKKVDIRVGQNLFTSLRLDGRDPVLWPVLNPAGGAMTRSFPFANVDGENRDHSHHRSIWFAHGDTNGNDFWHNPAAQVQLDSPIATTEGDGRGILQFQESWVGESGETICRGIRRIEPFTGSGFHGLDFDLTLVAGESGLLFGDTKEGTMAIRVAAPIKADAGGELIDSEGRKAKEVWGKRAKWVAASGELPTGPSAIVVMDHPSNLRHPTYWHARTYGLVAANPFGVSDFEGKARSTTETRIEPGKSIRFRYRMMFFSGAPTPKTLNRLFEDFAAR